MTETDILVLGSGSAGLFFALECAKHSKLNILVVTKKERSESNTNYAQGGIASVMNEHDSYEAHIRDTLIAGAGLCHEDAVKILVEEGPLRIRDLMELGAKFTHDKSGKLDLGKEGGHSTHRIVHTRDLTDESPHSSRVDRSNGRMPKRLPTDRPSACRGSASRRCRGKKSRPN